MILKRPVVMQQHVCATLIDIKDSIHIEKIIKKLDFKHTCIYVQKMVSPSKLQLRKMQTWWFSSFGFWENCTMEVIVHADDNFLFRDNHKFGLRKICKLLLVYLTLINDYSWIFVLFLKLLDEPAVCSIAANYNKSTAQVLLKWALQHDVGE